MCTEDPSNMGWESQPTARDKKRGEERVPMWDPIRKQKVSGAAAPKRKNITMYIKKYPQRSIFTTDRETGLERVARITIWDTKNMHMISGDSAPSEYTLLEYLVDHPDCDIYDGQDWPGYKRNARVANPRIPMYNRETEELITGPDAPYRKDALGYIRDHEDFVVYWGQANAEQRLKRKRASTPEPIECNDVLNMSESSEAPDFNWPENDNRNDDPLEGLFSIPYPMYPIDTDEISLTPSTARAEKTCVFRSASELIENDAPFSRSSSFCHPLGVSHDHNGGNENPMLSEYIGEEDVRDEFVDLESDLRYILME